MTLAELSSERAWLGIALIATGLALAPLGVAVARRVFDGRHVFFARWGFAHALLAFALLFGAQLVVFPLARQWVGGPLDGVSERVAALVALVPTAVLIFVLAAVKDPKGVSCLGMWPGRHLRAVALGVGAYVGWVPVVLGAGLAWPWIVDALGGDYRPQDAVKSLLALEGQRFWIAAVLAAAVQPFFEELIFRAFLQPLFVQNLGDRGGVFVASALFAALHGWNAFLPIFALSLLLGMLMLRSQRLLGVWAVHALHNTLVIYLLTSVPAARELLGQANLGLPLP
ncbi:MAG: CPBP family intramembrane metalloprotease [Planctomycetes bacterium]|nr:CPBP family intramembrane metalloprotease [Planctomycetota bacterium]